MTLNHAERLVGAYYFRGGMFTCIPEHVRADLDGMKSLGTDVVCIAYTHNDIDYNHNNIEFLVNEIHRRGMKVFIVPSRLAGITAGAPLNADGFGYHHPHTWTINEDGTPMIRKMVGAVCSFYHQEVEDYLISATTEMVNKYGVDGIIWDEPKTSNWQDFSQKARANNPSADYRIYMQDMAAFFSRINQAIKTNCPGLTICHFDEACRRDEVPEESAKIQHMDYFGVDGHARPAVSIEKATNQREQKIIRHYGERYINAAVKEKVKSLVLIENQRLTEEGLMHFENEMPQIMAMDIDFMIYYYYGFVQHDVEANMAIVKKYIGR